MARRLTNLKIQEVSSVDRGAGEGVKVLLMKRHDDPAGDDLIDMRGLLKSKTQERDMTEAELQALIAKAVGDVVKPLQVQLAKADAELLVLKMSPDEQDYCEKQKMSEEQRKEFAGLKPEDRAAKMKKIDETDPVAKALAPVLDQNETLRKQNSDMAKRLAALEGDREKADFAKRAKEMGLQEADGEIVRKAFGGDPDAQVALQKRITEITKARDEALKTGKVLKEIGFNGGGGDAGGDAPINKLWAKADEIRKADTKLSRHQAFDKAAEQNPELFAEVREAEKQRANVA